MPRAKRETALYRRGAYRLEWDRRGDGALRSPFLAVFWYDAERGRIRSASTGTADLEEAKRWLDGFYLERTGGRAVCPTCQRPLDAAAGLLVADALTTYQVLHADHLPSSEAIAARLAHVVDYIGTLPSAAVTVEHVDERWISGFRRWAESHPITSPRGAQRARSLSTIENSVIQMAAAIRFAQARGDTQTGPRFRAQPIKDLNRTPSHRSDVDELAAMFAYAVDQAGRGRAALHRFLIGSVATLARPDAVYDISTDPKRSQWNSKARILNLNPRGRRQTKKRRAIVPIAWQVAHHLDAASAGFFVGAKNIRSAWDAMATELELPGQGEAGQKLIRRSMANLLRSRGVPTEELEMMLGHRSIESTSELYAPFDPAYLAGARAAIEAVIDEIEAAAPGAFALPGGKVVTIGRKA